MKASERSRLHFVEAQAKRYKWRSVALIGVNDTGLARQFLAHFPRCKVLVVPIWREDLRPGPAGAQRNFQRNLRLWTKAYGGRFECEQGPPMKVAELTERQFDGVVLWTGIAPELLAVIGGAWVPRVVDGGWLLGVDHRLALVRSVLNQVAPGWVQYREGIWGVRVRRSGEAADHLAVVGDLNIAEMIHGDDPAADAEDETPLPVDGLLDAIPVAHDPVDSGSDVDDAVQVTAPSGGAEETERCIVPRRRPAREAVAATPSKVIATNFSEDVAVYDLDDSLSGGKAKLLKPSAVADRDALVRDVGNSNPPLTSSEPTATLPVGGSETHAVSPEADAATVAQPAPKRRGGRPKGSKNKPKVVAAE